MKRSKRLVLMLCLLAVLVAVGAAVSVLGGKDGEDTAHAVTEYTLTDFDAGDIARLDVTHGENEFSFQKENGEWVLVTTDAPKIDGELIDAAATKVSALKGHNKMTDVSTERLTDYGLARPEITVTVTLPSRSVTLLFGNYNGTAGECYFASEDDRSTVYTVESSVRETFALDYGSLTVKDELPKTEIESITSVSLGNVRYESVKTPKEDAEIGSDENEHDKYYYSAKKITGEGSEDISYADFERIASGISEMKLEYADFVDAGSTEYGFDDPKILIVGYSERKKLEGDGAQGGYIDVPHEYTVYIGMSVDTIYAKTSEASRVIYKLNADFITEYFG